MTTENYDGTNFCYDGTNKNYDGTIFRYDGTNNDYDRQRKHQYKRLYNSETTFRFIKCQSNVREFIWQLQSYGLSLHRQT